MDWRLTLFYKSITDVSQRWRQPELQPDPAD